MALTAGPLAAAPAAAKTTTLTFDYVGVTGTIGVPLFWVVPKGVYRATFDVYGAQGGRAQEAGGRGGEVSDTLVVKPGQLFELNPGGMPSMPQLFPGSGGYNGGGAGGRGPAQYGGGGGGASDVRKAPYNLDDRLLVAGGGGGGGGFYCFSGDGACGGGGAGGKTGGDGDSDACNSIFAINVYSNIIGSLIGTVNTYATGGSQKRGGTGATCGLNDIDNGRDGSKGKGGKGGGLGPIYCGNGTYANDPGLAGGGGGGGGGYYGGGGAVGGNAITDYGAYYGVGPPPSGSCDPWGGGGGAGGSSYGPSGSTFRTGVQRGSGKITVTYTPNCSKGAICVQGTPGAPTGVTAAAGVKSAKVAFAAPKHWPPILSYEVTAHPGNEHASGDKSPITVKGLKNGTSYTFTVTATNLLGTGPASKGSAAVTPEPLPDAPTGVSAVAGNGDAVVAFTGPPSSCHLRFHIGCIRTGSPVTSFTVTASPSGRKAIVTSSPATVAGLTNGDKYTFTVTATNGIGTGPASKPSNQVEPAGVPNPPTGVVAVASSGRANVSFLIPAANGSPIESYTIAASPGGESITATAPPVTFTGLTNGRTYTFTVTATNAVGTSLSSAASNAVTPETVPGAPTDVVATPFPNNPTEVTVTFDPPASDGGAAITSYTVSATSSNGGASETASGSGSPIVVTGLTSGKAYLFTVTATNAAGTGPPSTPVAPKPNPG